LIFTGSPNKAQRISLALEQALPTTGNQDIIQLSHWLSKHYHSEWHLPKALMKGVGIHHGRIPRAIGSYIIEQFNDGHLKYLICTSTIIEGVNTSAKNVIVYDKKIKNKNIDFFTFNNILGRCGRMFKHFVGKAYLFSDFPAQKLPLVDFPIFSQPETMPSEMLVYIDSADLSEMSANRMKTFHNQTLLDMHTLKSLSGVSIDDALSFANSLRQNHAMWWELMNWRGEPTPQQLQHICYIIFEFFHGSHLANHSIASSKQLNYFIRAVQHNTPMKELIQNQLAYNNSTTPDEAIQKVLDIFKLWLNYHFPNILLSIDLIQKDVFTKFRLKPGDYKHFGTSVESLFLDAALITLEEYGIPIEISRRIQHLLSAGNDLDKSIIRLKSLNRKSLHLEHTERLILETALEHL